MSFARQLEFGRVAEGLIAKWLQSRGTAVMPAYEIEKSHGKGPQLFSPEGEFVAPDMIAFTHEGVQWIEAKHKTVFSWHRNSSRWVTGIDRRHYQDYQHVMVRTRLPVWLLFFHREPVPDARDAPYSPPQCPTGLFAGSLERLMKCESHTSGRWGRSGMVYWAHDKLKLLATKAEVLQANGIEVSQPAPSPDEYEEGVLR